MDDRTDDMAQFLVKLLRDEPQLFKLIADTMQDPRQNHIIKEEEEITDL